ncbi:MAG: hypothetical protein K2Y28_06290 [Burkholderiaceae bacterium]|nr:hypothetical protein [Burkholderiaceae bacterium]
MNIIFNIWMQPVYARLNLENKKTLFILMSLFPLIGQIFAALAFFFGTKHIGLTIFLYAFLFSIAALFAILALVWYCMLILNIRSQYCPTVANLVPKIRTYLKRATMLPIMICTCLVFIVDQVIHREFSISLTILCIGMMLSFAIYIRTNWGLLAIALSIQTSSISEKINFHQRLEAYSGILVNITFLGVLFGIIYITVNWIFSSGKDSQFTKNEANIIFQKMKEGKKVGESRGVSLLDSAFLYWMKLRVAACQGKPSQHNDQLKLIGFSLEPRLHWTTTLFQVVAMGILGSLLILLLNVFLSPSTQSFMKIFFAITVSALLLCLPLFFLFVLFSSLFHTRGEQQLFRLTEKSMGAKMQDLALTNYLLRQFLILYSLSFGVALFVGMYKLDSAEKIGSLVLWMTCLFSLMLSIVRNHGQMRTVNDHPMIKNLLLCLLIFAIGMVFVLGAPRIAIFWYCALVFVSTLALLVLKMRANAQIKIFPVGRAA